MVVQASQIGIAVVSLMWTGDPGPTDIINIPGLNNITIANLSNFAQTRRFTDDDLVESFTANQLGNIGASYNYSLIPQFPLAETPWAAEPAMFWDGGTYWELHRAMCISLRLSSISKR